MEIIYRVYEKVEGNNTGWFNDNIILQQEVCHCETREQFKEMMRDMYGKDVAFRNSSKLEAGKIFISIISENCYNPELYLKLFKHKCSECGKEWLANGKEYVYGFREALVERESPAYHQLNKYNFKWSEARFCCTECRDKYEKVFIDEAIKFREQNDDVEDIWITKERYSSWTNGYIYMISKKSTGEFYVGKTKYNPVFRWGQHLLTNRFKMDNINDYVFEVLEQVNDLNDLAAREAYWINKKRNENPSLSLNIQIPKEDNRISIFDIIDKKEE